MKIMIAVAVVLLCSACTQTRTVTLPAPTQQTSAFTSEKVLGIAQSWPLVDGLTITGRDYFTLRSALEAAITRDCHTDTRLVKWEALPDGPGRWEIHANFNCTDTGHQNNNTWEFFEQGPRLLGVSGQATTVLSLR